MGNAGVPWARSSRLRAVPAVRALRLRMRNVCWVAETMGARSIAGAPELSTAFQRALCNKAREGLGEEFLVEVLWIESFKAFSNDPKRNAPGIALQPPARREYEPLPGFEHV
jgi:hypothetical protein